MVQGSTEFETVGRLLDIKGYVPITLEAGMDPKYMPSDSETVLASMCSHGCK